MSVPPIGSARLAAPAIRTDYVAFRTGSRHHPGPGAGRIMPKTLFWPYFLDSPGLGRHKHRRGTP